MMDPNSPSAQMCCPDPATSAVIPEDAETGPVRRKLHFLFKAQIPATVLWMIVGGPFAIINQLLMLWMIYLCYATMHFCQTIFVSIFFTLSFLQLIGPTFSKDTTGFKFFILALLFVYSSYGMYISCVAQSLFRRKYDAMRGAGNNSYQMGGNIN